MFPRRRIAVFVDGCFWHGCPSHGSVPATNTEAWTSKIAANVARDRDTDRQLAEAGWTVERVWAHEPVDEAARRVFALVTTSDTFNVGHQS